jgi:RNA polymerase sigma-70 factor (ECF subfamily)
MMGARAGRDRSDSELIARSCAQPEAFEALFERHARAVAGYLARRVPAAVAEDVVAETFCTAFDQRDRYRHEYADARPWLLGIATNLVRRHHRSERIRRVAWLRAASSIVSESEEARVLESVAAASSRQRLRSALGRLRRADRDALLLHVWGQLTYVEVARSLGVPVGTVRSRINRARRRLRELLGDLGAIDGEKDHEPEKPRPASADGQA